MRRFIQLGAMFVLLTALASASVMGASPAAADPGLDPIFDSLTPAPYSTVAPGTVLIAAHVVADTPFETVTLWIDGTQIEQLTDQPDSALSISQQHVLSEGTHTATVEAKDGDGSYLHTQWDFIVSSNASEGEWFTAAGQPKADQINATMRSLVEAFRWHLYGLSWDGSPHPDLPTHVGFQGTGAPLTPWVNGTTFDQANTQATLRSLVEAFRWHFWGISWDGANHPDVPTHASTVLPPQSIDPWFTAAGQPIPDNITATLRSLVESFRWHFWGYSWDGNQHPDIPTHATYELNDVPGETGTIYQTAMTDVDPVNSTLGSVGVPTADGYALTVQPNVADGVSNLDQQFGDASYSVTMRKQTESGDAAGCLLFRIVDTPEGGLYQGCFVYSGTTLVEARLMYLSGAESSNARVEDLAQQTFMTPLNGADWNTLTVIARSNQFWLLANGIPLGLITHDGNSTGEVGISVYNLTTGTPQTIEFTNLTIKGVEPPSADTDSFSGLRATTSGTFEALNATTVELIEAGRP